MTAQFNAIPNGDQFSGRDNFAMAYDHLLFNTQLSHQALRLFLILMRYGRNGECFPSQERLATDMGCTTRTIRSTLAELYQFELVDNLGRIKYRSNSYALADCSQPVKVVPPVPDQPAPNQAREPEENIRINRKKTSAKGELVKENLRVCESASIREGSEDSERDIPQQPLIAYVRTNPQDPPIRDKTPKPKRGYANIEARFNARPILGDRDNGQNREQEAGAGSRSRF